VARPAVERSERIEKLIHSRLVSAPIRLTCAGKSGRGRAYSANDIKQRWRRRNNQHKSICNLKTRDRIDVIDVSLKIKL